MSNESSLNRSSSEPRFGDDTGSNPTSPPNVGSTDNPLRNTDGVASLRRVRPQSQWEQLLSSRKWVLLLLFCVTGFLGLPVLWLSYAFTTTEKIVWSIVNIAYTLMLIGACAGVIYWCYLRFQHAGLI
ncbi:MAG: hypothetical protein FJ308_00400 [Planctomycetes bacterium]|nr:hypothetical protein [Planctomycetota bacterium]